MTIRPPVGLSPEVWRRIGRAKQTLIKRGPKRATVEAAQSAVITAASELRMHGVSQRDALTVIRAMPTRSTSPRKIKRELRHWVEYAYKKQAPLLSGCPQVSTAPSAMRDSFSGYCDDECKRTCAVRRASLAPEGILLDTGYYAMYVSPIWMSGTHGLGLGAKQLWTIMASMAVMEQSPLIQASMPYLARRLMGSVHLRTMYRHARILREHRLIEIVSRVDGRYRVPIFSPTQLRQLEAELLVDRVAAMNVVYAVQETQRRNERRDEAFPPPLTADELETLIYTPSELAAMKAQREMEQSYCFGAELTLEEMREMWGGELVNFPSVKPWTTEDEAAFIRNGRRFLARSA